MKKRLDLAKKGWVKELPCVLWSYKMTIHMDTKETPFKLTFGQDTVILIDIGQTSNVFNYSEEINDRLRANIWTS